jgi:hypothetical protein
MGRVLIAGASRIEYLDEKKLKKRRKKMEPAISQRDIEKLDEGIAQLEAADVNPEFKKAALAIYQDSKALAIEMVPLFLRGEKIAERVDALLEKYPSLRKYV